MSGTHGTVDGPTYHGGPELGSGTVGAFRCYLEAEAHPGAVPAARHAARQALAEWCLDHISDDTEVVLSELLTNAIRATQAAAPPGQFVAVYLALDLDRLFILVWDCCQELPVRGGPAGGEAEDGRGLEIVSALAERWGTCTPDEGGKVVWAQLALTRREAES